MICHAHWRFRGRKMVPTPALTLPPALGPAEGSTKAKGAAIKAKTSEELTGKRRPAEDVYTKLYGNEINMADTLCCTSLTKSVFPPSLRAFHTLLHHGGGGGGSVYVGEVEQTHDKADYRDKGKKMTQNSVFPPS